MIGAVVAVIYVLHGFNEFDVYCLRSAPFDFAQDGRTKGVWHDLSWGGVCAFRYFDKLSTQHERSAEAYDKDNPSISLK